MVYFIASKGVEMGILINLTFGAQVVIIITETVPKWFPSIPLD